MVMNARDPSDSGSPTNGGGGTSGGTGGRSGRGGLIPVGAYEKQQATIFDLISACLLYTSPSPRDS